MPFALQDNNVLENGAGETIVREDERGIVRKVDSIGGCAGCALTRDVVVDEALEWRGGEALVDKRSSIAWATLNDGDMPGGVGLREASLNRPTTTR